MPVCSVIVPCYNEQQYLASCLQTLLSQSLKDVEIIVVDDGSTDCSRQIAEAAGVRVLAGQHRGPGVARNLGAAEAHSDILVFVDADMEFHPQYLARLIEPIQSGLSKGTFHVDEYVANPENVWATCWTLQERCPLGRRIRPDHPPYSSVFRALLKAEFLRVGGYDDVGYGEDVTVSAKLGYQAVLARGAICFHNNPASLREVYQSARWIGRGQHTADSIAFLLRLTLPFAMLRGIRQARRFHLLAFVVFQMCFDAGLLSGLLSRRLGHGHVK